MRVLLFEHVAPCVGGVSISRAWFTVEYPAPFMLVACMNPCLCSHPDDPRKPCEYVLAEALRAERLAEAVRYRALDREAWR